MTKRLILIRHAKSSWEDLDADDFERPLNQRGQVGADAIGKWLGDGGYHPDEVLVSAAARTVETWDRIALNLPEHSVDKREALYHASPDTLLSELQSASGNCVAIVGHNPGISMFARGAVDTAPAHPRFDVYPTGATLVVDFPTEDWKTVELGTGRVRNFVVPRDFTRATT